MDWAALPPLTALRAFAAYADTGSMTEAGARLNVSHAAVSQQIKGLEDHLGLSLLDRARGGGALTPEGRVLAETALEGFSAIARLAAELTGKDAERPVQISTTPTFASAWLMPRLARFRQKHPDISLMVDPSPELRDIKPGGLDMALRYGSGNWPGLEAELVVETPIAVVASPDLVGTSDYASPSDLTNFHWLQELGTNEASDFLEQNGAVLNKARGLTSMPGNLVVEAARSGQGVAVSARAFLEPDIQSGRLRLLFEDTRKKGYFLVYRPGVMRPSARAFYRWLVSEAASLK
ncbi:LysR family transcriptional regulator [Primorskyibacter flagellatus]|uniref:LysR family transcriptional regulator n=1 Tax=Primorskyibacter flagellatus TaxID=1387277 RepID=A0A917EJ66_9RHOB|nr:LysR family transcriptional regulator [Primorskyibacter flagellatus]GGE42036.1 LysR family transcriptional regulator [Primorskyibacter flagellatus]